MDHDALRLFLNLSRTLHFGRTSKECHISPSALSRAIQRMEDEVGCALFERDRRTVRLTPEGVVLQAHAAETLQRWQAVRQKLAGESQSLAGSIAIFASVTACQSFLPAALSSFRARYPDIHIRLETGYAADALAMLERDAVDVAVAAIPEHVPPSLQARVLLHTPLVLVAPSSDCETSQLIERRPVPWAEVPMVLPASGIARKSADAWFRRRRTKPRLYSELPGSEAILSLVALGCGAGIVPRIVAEKSPLRAEVRILDPEPSIGEFRVGVATPRRKLPTPIVRAFWESLPKSVSA